MIRVMPNTPCLVSETAAGMAAGKHALPADLDDVGAIFSTLGKCLPVTEAQIDGMWKNPHGKYVLPRCYCADSLFVVLMDAAFMLLET